MYKKQLRQEWSGRVADYEASGLTMVAWCTKHNFTIHQLKYWLKKFRSEQPQSESPTSFLPVAVAADLGTAAASDRGIAILVGEARIDIQPGVSPELLREVIRALRPC